MLWNREDARSTSEVKARRLAAARHRATISKIQWSLVAVAGIALLGFLLFQDPPNDPSVGGTALAAASEIRRAPPDYSRTTLKVAEGLRRNHPSEKEALPASPTGPRSTGSTTRRGVTCAPATRPESTTRFGSGAQSRSGPDGLARAMTGLAGMAS